MRILVINTVRFKLNGISAVIMNYYKAMNKNDLNMDFLAIDTPSEEYQDEFKKNGIKCYVVNKENVFAYFAKLIVVARKGKYDIAHVHGNSANMAVELLACKLAGIKIRIAHSHNTSTMHPIMHKLLYPLFRMTCTHGFACGEDAGHWLFHDREFVEIENGIDLKRFKFDANVRTVYREKIAADNRIVIGHIGNFVEQKNHTFFLDWFAELVREHKNYLLLMISDGYLLGAMKEKSHKLCIEDKVLFLGKTTEVQSYLQAMDIFVLPSLHEGLPVVLIEAQACGLPCIVADTVAKEADLTRSFKFLPITNTQCWINAILDEKVETSRSERCNKWQDIIASRGYDINQNADRMKDLYIKYCNK